jgi:hypothetical protein
MKNHKKIFSELDWRDDGGSTTLSYKEAMKLAELAAKQAFEYGRLLIDNPDFREEELCADEPEILKYEEFEDYLKDLENGR